MPAVVHQLTGQQPAIFPKDCYQVVAHVRYRGRTDVQIRLYYVEAFGSAQKALRTLRDYLAKDVRISDLEIVSLTYMSDGKALEWPMMYKDAVAMDLETAREAMRPNYDGKVHVIDGRKYRLEAVD